MIVEQLASFLRLTRYCFPVLIVLTKVYWIALFCSLVGYWFFKDLEIMFVVRKAFENSLATFLILIIPLLALPIDVLRIIRLSKLARKLKIGLFDFSNLDDEHKNRIEEKSLQL